MQVRRFHKNRKNVQTAPIISEGSIKLHSIEDGKATFEVARNGADHTIYLVIDREDFWNLWAIRDIMKGERPH